MAALGSENKEKGGGGGGRRLLEICIVKIMNDQQNYKKIYFCVLSLAQRLEFVKNS